MDLGSIGTDASSPRSKATKSPQREQFGRGQVSEDGEWTLECRLLIARNNSKLNLHHQFRMREMPEDDCDESLR